MRSASAEFVAVVEDFTLLRWLRGSVRYGQIARHPFKGNK
ncbi:unnamed protein product (plasmid) [Mycetohabitans rhizoxinica HKI 454]|uniref:Uncharacterized protein n=1 Tax=Mycetohabitans rhizoxinica (strain DSM 19002 / CIP 109453 / HKI 454) TaxID=882378 RepID=E5AV51_MYCRK|nr:unnamed protein product [Mycetohabitans rhizoxinica HKI 454]